MFCRKKEKQSRQLPELPSNNLNYREITNQLYVTLSDCYSNPKKTYSHVIKTKYLQKLLQKLKFKNSSKFKAITFSKSYPVNLSENEKQQANKPVQLINRQSPIKNEYTSSNSQLYATLKDLEYNNIYNITDNYETPTTSNIPSTIQIGSKLPMSTADISTHGDSLDQQQCIYNVSTISNPTTNNEYMHNIKFTPPPNLYHRYSSVLPCNSALIGFNDNIVKKEQMHNEAKQNHIFIPRRTVSFSSSSDGRNKEDYYTDIIVRLSAAKIEARMQNSLAHSTTPPPLYSNTNHSYYSIIQNSGTTSSNINHTSTPVVSTLNSAHAINLVLDSRDYHTVIPNNNNNDQPDSIYSPFISTNAALPANDILHITSNGSLNKNSLESNIYTSPKMPILPRNGIYNLRPTLIYQNTYDTIDYESPGYSQVLQQNDNIARVNRCKQHSSAFSFDNNEYLYSVPKINTIHNSINTSPDIPYIENNPYYQQGEIMHQTPQRYAYVKLNQLRHHKNISEYECISPYQDDTSLFIQNALYLKHDQPIKLPSSHTSNYIVNPNPHASLHLNQAHVYQEIRQF